MRGLVMTASGRPCPGTLVSDGVTVTTTGHDGRFTLSPAGSFVFVTRPAEWTCARWFVPANTPDVTFVLEPSPGVFPHHFIHISDTHVGRGLEKYPKTVQLGSGALLARFLTRVADEVPHAQSVIATGDLTDAGIDDEYDELRTAVAASRLPVHLLPGNHDHMDGRLIPQLGRNGYRLHTADPAAYERNLGPRWYSFDLPGLHVIALDWHTHELGIDHEIQNEWMRADLESIPADTPWILLSHDQPWHSILGEVPRQPIATFSGHRHTSRVVQVGPTLHVNTPTPLFAGIDFTPPSFRVVKWDGEAISLETRTTARNGLERSTFAMGSGQRQIPLGSRWRHQLDGAGHTSSVRVAGELLIAGVRDEDRARGGVEAIVAATGESRWRAPMRSSVKSTPAVHGDTVVAVEVSGDTVCLDLADGSERWRSESPDPLRLFAFADPLVHEGVVVVGDMSHLRGLDVDTGETLWERRDITPYQTQINQTAPVISGSTVVIGSWPAPQSFMGIDVHSGETLWTGPKGDGQVLSSDTAVWTPLVDNKTGDLVLSSLGMIARVDGQSGVVRWRRSTTLPWNPATPVATDRGIVVIEAGEAVLLLDRDSGEALWSTAIEGSSALAMTSYRQTPHVLFAGATVHDRLLLVPGLDGLLRVLDVDTGEIRGSLDVGVPVAAPVTVSAGVVIATGIDGTITAFAIADLPL